jgi:hypothetical protein
MRAWSKLTETCEDTYYSKNTSKVAQRALRVSNQDSNEGERQNDAPPLLWEPMRNEVVFVVFQES